MVREHQHYQGPFHPDNGTAVWHHRYDELNQRIGTTRPDGHRVDWLTYGAGHVHGLLLDGQELVSFERDALHRETGRTQANGLLQTMKYDPLGRLIEQHLGAMARVNRKDRDVFPDLYRPDVQVGMQAAILRRYRYDPSGQLASIEDSRRGRLEYRYDPVGRLLAANSVLGHETFAFDPAGNIQAPDTAQQEPIARRAPLPKLLDNLLKEYAGVSYRYDERGNLIERVQNAQRDTFERDAFNRMTRASTRHGVTTFAYDPLGRRVAKHSQATRTMYGWDGDTLALESSVHRGHAAGERTVHYAYERGSFVPLVQATRSRAVRLAHTTDVKALMADNDGKYDIALDPLWNGEYEQEAEPFGKDEIAFYQCDHLGTPQELTDCEGKVAWSAQYKAWGKAKEAISEAARKAGIRNPIRFQGQYLDEETGLHYNRHRYYDTYSGRFVSSDPIGLRGGLNLHQYAPNPLLWVDPLGLTSGKAIIRHYDTGSRTGHCTVETHQGERKIHTHQVQIDEDRNTTIIDEKKYEQMSGDPIARQVEVELPDAAAAQKYQRSVEEKDGGRYDEHTNSCMTHVGNVLCVGGVAVPEEPLVQGKYFRRIGFQLGLRRGER